jgi:hypothetical protein
MPLTLRRTGLSPPSEDREDWTVFRGEWAIGRIYGERGTPDHMRWFWSFHGTNVPATITRSGHVPTLEEAKHQFSASWEAWKAWAKLAESKDDAEKPGTVAKPGGLLNRETEQVMADKPNGHVVTTT